MLKRLALLFISLSMLAMTGCFLAPRTMIAFDLVYTSTGTDVTIHYRMPAAPPGKYLILWLLAGRDTTGTTEKIAKVGEIPPSSSMRAVRVTADFQVEGAIVSIEPDPNVSVPGDVWMLDGRPQPTPTPSGP